MSLAALNSPPLVAASGAVAASLLPTLEQAIIDGSIPFNTVKLVNALLYILNVFATQQPGRIDGIKQEEFEGIKEAREADELAKALLPERRGRSLVSPSGFAFIIWAPIFLGELIFVATSAFLKETSRVSTVVKKMSAGFMMGQIFQTLWTASFRRKYKGKLIYISGAMLSGIAYSLSRAHAGFVFDGDLYDMKEYLLYFFPITLHFGWTTAAALVNWNGSIAMGETVSPKLVAWSGYLSAILATGLGVFVTMARQAPVFGIVIAWALAACATGMHQRLEETKEERDQQRVGIYGARVQKWLCGLGALVSGASSILAAISLKKIE